MSSREIVKRHFERKDFFSTASCKVVWEFLTEPKTSIFVAKQHLYNYNIGANVCNIWSLGGTNYFERIESSSTRHFRTLDGGSVRKGRQNFALVSCSFEAYSKLHRLAFTWLDAKMDIRVYLAGGKEKRSKKKPRKGSQEAQWRRQSSSFETKVFVVMEDRLSLGLP